MNPQENIPNGDPKFEMGLEAREVISLFQQAKAATGDEQIKLLEKFREKLLDIVTPPGPNSMRPTTPGRTVKRVVLEETDDCLAVGTGTSGQRIHFKQQIEVHNNWELADRLGKGAKKNEETWEGTGGEKFFNIRLESEDGKPRWMQYYRPQDKDYTTYGGGKYWERFMNAFGGEIVDLLQEIENK
jgi:hypothetical protein